MKPGSQFKRREYKFLVDNAQARAIGGYLAAIGLKPDSFSAQAKNQSYYVASLYLDTPNYQAYWDKKYGVEYRAKYRLRTYAARPAANPAIYWEIKRRYGDFFKKDRSLVSLKQVRDFLDKKISFNKLVSLKRLAPAVLVSYRRRPWLDPFYPGLRLTFDFQIEAALPADLFSRGRQARVLPGKQIMEVKFSGPVPGYLQQLNQKFNLERQSLSKYCLSLEACDIVSEEKNFNE